jgi:ABC-type antimicrobial peptide transport system permease subunit
MATLVLVPAYWFLLAGWVSAVSDNDSSGPGTTAGPFIAFGVSLIPFVFVVLAFLSEHPRAAGAVVRAMGLAILVGIPVSALAGDALTGPVAGIGAGGIAALRSEVTTNRRWRILAVVAVSVYVFVLARTFGVAAVLLAPCLPFTAIGVADHLAERKAEKEAAAAPAG